MTGSDVRDVDALIALRLALVRLGERLQLDGQHLRATTQHARTHFTDDVPAYWLTELRNAERRLAEADLRLRQKQAAIRPGDAAPATEEKKQVRRWSSRKRLCEEKLHLCRRVAIEMDQAAEKFQGPVADLVEMGATSMPSAVAQLTSLIDRLLAYQDRADPSSPRRGPPGR